MRVGLFILFACVTVCLAADPQIPRGDLLGDLFGLGNAALKAADQAGQEMLRLLPAEENRVGAEVHQMIRRKYTLYQDAPTVARVKRLAEPLLQARQRKEIQYTFHLVEARQTNAFSHLGGFIYLNRGLLNFARTDAELQFVVSHEIAHVDLGQCARKVTYAHRARQIGGTAGKDISSLVQAAYSVAAAGFSQAEELLADEWAFKTMRAAGRSRKEALASPKAFSELEGQPRAPRPASEKTAVVELLDNHFRTHPPAAVRLQHLEKLD